MKNFTNLAKVLSLALLLAFSIALQSLLMSYHGHASGFVNSDDYQTIIICTDGEFREIVVDSNGQPVDETGHGPHCPLCLAAEKVYLQAALGKVSASFGISKEYLFSPYLHNGSASREPDNVNCLDPPISV